LDLVSDKIRGKRKGGGGGKKKGRKKGDIFRPLLISSWTTYDRAKGKEGKKEKKRGNLCAHRAPNLRVVRKKKRRRGGKEKRRKRRGRKSS